MFQILRIVILQNDSLSCPVLRAARWEMCGPSLRTPETWQEDRHVAPGCMRGTVTTTAEARVCPQEGAAGGRAQHPREEGSPQVACGLGTGRGSWGGSEAVFSCLS